MSITGIPEFIGSLIGGHSSSNAQRDANNKNLQAVRETNKQNMYLNRVTWDREDNAATRRALDLQRAGLSKTLAAGGAASTGSPIQVQAPKVEPVTAMGESLTRGIGSLKAGGAIDAYSTVLEQSNLQRQGDLLSAQANYYNSMANKNDEQRPFLLQGLQLANVGTELENAARELQYDLDTDPETGKKAMAQWANKLSQSRLETEASDRNTASFQQRHLAMQDRLLSEQLAQAHVDTLIKQRFGLSDAQINNMINQYNKEIKQEEAYVVGESGKPFGAGLSVLDAPQSFLLWTFRALRRTLKRTTGIDLEKELKN